MKKTAIITGTGSGLGKELGKILLYNGYHVIGYSRKNQIIHPNFNFIKKDLSKTTNLINLTIPKIKLDNEIILVNNAANIGKIATINKKSKSDITSEYNLNIVAPTILSSQIINKYPANNKLIVNISSGASIKAISSWSTYCASKAALDMLTNVIDNEKHENLNIISIHPGIINTNMQKTIRNAKKADFPLKHKFMDYYKQNMLDKPNNTAKKIYYIIKNYKKFKQKIVSVRDIKLK